MCVAFVHLFTLVYVMQYIQFVIMSHIYIFCVVKIAVGIKDSSSQVLCMHEAIQYSVNEVTCMTFAAVCRNANGPIADTPSMGYPWIYIIRCIVPRAAV